MTNISDDPSHSVYIGNCVDLLQDWSSVGWTCDLLFADPPFNIGQDYDTHFDNMPWKDFELFTESWLSAAAKCVRPGGIMAVNVPDSMVCSVMTFCPLQRIDWVIWHYRFGQCVKTKFISSKTHLLVFRNGTLRHTWNGEAIHVESDRSSKYNDARTLESASPGMRVPFDVWCDIPRVVGNSHERVPECPNQLPERYLERVIRAYSHLGDIVLDPFCGSGTTSAVAKRLGRLSVTVDVSELRCRAAVGRLQSVVVV